MTHDDARVLLSAVADGEAAVTPDLQDHLAGCTACAAYAADLDRLAVLTAALPRPAVPSTLPARVARRIRRRRRARWAVPALAAATAAAVILTTLPGPGTALLPLPPAAAAEPLLTLRSLYVERTLTGPTGETVEKIWWRAPGSVRVERSGPAGDEVVVETPAFRYQFGTLTEQIAPGIALPEPLSPTVALLGTDRGAGPTVAGLPTRTYEVTVAGQTRTVYVADGVGVGGRDSVVVTKKLGGAAIKRARVVRLNPDLPDSLFEPPAGAKRVDAKFRERPLGELAIAPARLPEGFAVVRSGAGPAGEAYVLVRGSLPVLVTYEAPPTTDVGELRTVTHEGRAYEVVLDLYRPPAVRVPTPAGLVTVAAPLPVESLVALAVAMYAVE